MSRGELRGSLGLVWILIHCLAGRLEFGGPLCAAGECQVGRPLESHQMGGPAALWLLHMELAPSARPRDGPRLFKTRPAGRKMEPDWRLANWLARPALGSKLHAPRRCLAGTGISKAAD